ncbi:ArgP/LysG family DNA-binding transcriptional regulator [Reinekea thalattae]|uniref:ArgP/LysG family DNA-binding transcriptional regulator n=1 Tax=Reinekea thalattae TaxID=2593301 RepID=A0A5C8ZA74_9GAMM|nr:ArgP/LysG family DNA-binding transcriptional regulator [Reinekea thalattae]TXR54189.1 ArgP/LysG family DNA-binding transcriptional regulator [Reinekea thalattae]
MIDYRELQALAAVVAEKGFEKAAQQLHITQSAVSQRIKQLESKLGQPVLLRQTPPMATDLGLQLINHLQTVQHLEADLQLSSAQHEQINARIALAADCLGTWFGQALAPVSERINAELITVDQDMGIELMRRGQVLASLCADDTPIHGAQHFKLGIMRYRAYASADFVKRFRLDESPENLYQTPALIFNEDDQLQHRYLKLLNQPDPTNTHRCPSTEGFIQLIKEGCGFGLMPEMQVQQWGLEHQLVDVSPEHTIDIALYWHCWQSAGSVMKALTQSVIATTKELLIQKPSNS